MQLCLLTREVLLHQTFDIANKFDDAKEVRNAWEKTKFPYKLMTFFASLFQMKMYTLISFSMQLKQDESNNDRTIFSAE